MPRDDGRRGDRRRRARSTYWTRMGREIDENWGRELNSTSVNTVTKLAVRFVVAYRTNGLITERCLKRPKSRSADQSARTPWCWHKATMRAS